MFQDKNIKYEPLESQDTEVQACYHCKHRSVTLSCSNRCSVFMICFMVQVVNVLLFLGGYTIVQFTHGQRNRVSLDNYFELTKYNTTKHFLGNATLIRPSALADQFWDLIQTTDGIVTVPTEWALQHFTPSAPSPENPAHSIYQVDVFHSIHCLYRIRNRLIGEQSQPISQDDTHTLHCVDYLREQLICHGDIMLQATTDYFHYDKNYGHQCRDHDALKNWVLEHQWEGHKKFLQVTQGVEFKDDIITPSITSLI